MQREIWGSYFTSDFSASDTAIAILDGSTVTGGNSSYYYIGQFDFKGEQVTARLNVKKFAPGKSVFHEIIPEFSLALSGKRTGDEANLKGYIEGHPELKIHLRMKKLDEYSLPK